MHACYATLETAGARFSMDITAPSFEPFNCFSAVSYRTDIWKRSLAGSIGTDVTNDNYFCLQLKSAIDAKLWVSALRLLVDRHDSLRIACRDTEPGPLMEAKQQLSDLPFERVDLTDQPISDRLDLALAEAREVVWRPFELEGRVLWRAQLVTITDGDFLATLVVHHIVSDAVSILILRHDLLSNYEKLLTGRGCPANASQHVGFISFLRCMNNWLTGPGGRLCRQYWADRSRDAIPVGYVKSHIDTPIVPRQTFTMTSDSMRHVARRAKDLGTTSHHVLMAAQAIALHRLTGDPRATIANVRTGRYSLSLARTSGYLADRLYITVELRRKPTLGSVLESIARDVSHSYRFRYYPYEAIRRVAAESKVAFFAPVFNYLPRMGQASVAQFQMEILTVDLLAPSDFTAPPADMPYSMTITEHEAFARLEYRTCYENLQCFPQVFLSEVYNLLRARS